MTFFSSFLQLLDLLLAFFLISGASSFTPPAAATVWKRSSLDGANAITRPRPPTAPRNERFSPATAHRGLTRARPGLVQVRPPSSLGVVGEAETPARSTARGSRRLTDRFQRSIGSGVKLPRRRAFPPRPRGNEDPVAARRADWPPFFHEAAAGTLKPHRRTTAAGAPEASNGFFGLMVPKRRVRLSQVTPVELESQHAKQER